MKRSSLLAGLLALAFHTGCTFDRTEKVSSTSGLEESKVAHADKARPAPSPKISSDTHMAAGRMLERQGDLESAIGQYERAIAANPRLISAYNRLGIVYQKLGRFANADYIFIAGLRADAGSATLHNNLGYSYLLQQRFNDAEKHFREALTIAPDFERARMNLAIALGYLGRMDESRGEFALVVAPDIAHYNVALLELHHGNYEAARSSLNQALAINPACPGAQDQLRRVEALAARAPDARPVPALSLPSTLAGEPSSDVDPGP